MPDSRELIQRVAQEIEASSKTSPTPPGQSKPDRKAATDAHVETLNQVFALFRLNYHNQYYAAFPDATQLNQIKKLWLESLSDYPVEHILKGARHAIEHSEYLPTLNRMLECCQQGLADFGLPLQLPNPPTIQPLLDFIALDKKAANKKVLESLIKTHNQQGGTLINLNVISKEQILEAHEDPSKHPDLVVRVTGYSAYFHSLSKEYRQQIVDRWLA